MDTLEAATAELLAMNDASGVPTGPPPSAASSGGAAAVAVPLAVALIAIAVSFSAGAPSGTPSCNEESASSACVEKAASGGFDANAQVKRNLKKWAAKNLPSAP